MKLREDTKLRNFPAYCKKCKNEILITIEPRNQFLKGIGYSAHFFICAQWSSQVAYRNAFSVVAGSNPACAIASYGVNSNSIVPD